MTSDAANVGLGVRRALEVGMGAGMAFETSGIELFRGRLGGAKDLGDIASAFNVGLARAMAVFARDAFAAMHLCHFGMRIGLESLGDFLMTGGANLGADKVAGFGISDLCCDGLGIRRILGRGRRCRGSTQCRRPQKQDQ